MIVKQIIAEAVENDILLFTQDGKLGFKQKSQGPFPDCLKLKIKENKDALVAYLELQHTQQLDIPVRDPALKRLPLSNAQQRLWFIDSLKQGSAEYNQPVAFNIEGDIDISLIENVIDQIVSRHEILRTTYHQGDDGPYQQVNAHKPFTVTCIDITAKWNSEKEAEKLLREDANHCFDLTQDLMLRVMFIHTNQSRDPSKAQGVIQFNTHHIASDGWSQQVLIKEFVTLYNAIHQGAKLELAPLEIQYADFAFWQQKQQGQTKQSLSYWQQNLSGAPAVHNLPLRQERPQAKQHEGKRVQGSLNSSIAKPLLAIAHQLQLTPFMLIHGLVSLLISRHSYSNDIVIGTPVANRINTQLEPLIGFFVNTLPLRINTDQNTLASYLQHVKQVHLSAQEHQDVQFDQIVEHLNIERSGQYSPLCQIMLTTSSEFGVNSTQTVSLPSVELQPLESSRVVAKFDIDIHISIDEQGVELNWLYDVSLFDEQFIQKLHQNLCQLLLQVSLTSKPDVALSDLQILSNDEYEQTLQLGYGKLTPRNKIENIHQIIEEHALSQPTHLAIETQYEKMTFAELNNQANHIALWLRSLNVKEGQLIGLCLAKGTQVVAAMLAVWKLGAAYIPLDPNQPKERLKQIIEDAKPEHVICDDVTLSINLPSSVKLIDKPTELTSSNIDRPCSGKDLSYVIYTSGSTGKPKGVMISHQAFSNFCNSEQTTLAYNNASKIFNPLTLSFDAGNGFLWAPLVAGGSVYLENQVKNGLTTHFDTMEEKSITHAVFSASMLNEQEVRAVPGLKYLVSGGSDINQTLAAKLGDTILVNCYGPTETTVTATASVVTHTCSSNIGKAINNYQTLVLGKQMEIIPQGSPGELFIGGIGLARGYLNQPQMTAERFIENPYFDANNPASSQRLYRTGDLVRYLPDGNLAFIGRVDDQIKIRGFRIELGEIAHQLNQQAGIDSSLVLAKEGPAGKYLVAYLKPINEVAQAEHAEFIEQTLCDLGASLPDYMVPSLAVVVQDWPLTANGKIDKKSLPAADTAQLQQEYIAAQNEAEQAVVTACADLLSLDVDTVSTKTNFFTLGGHSLLLMQLASQLRRQGFAVDAQALFSAKTLQEMAASLSVQQAQQVLSESLIPAGCDRLTPEMVPLVSLTNSQLDEIAEQVPGGAGNIKDIYPLAPLQEGVLFVHSMNEQNDPYVTSFMYEMKHKAGLDTLIDSLNFLLARHDVLRTAVLWRGRPQALQVVQKDVKLPVSWLEENAEQSAQQVIAELAEGPQWLDIERAPLLQLQVCQDAQTGYYYALLQSHHLIVDHVAMEVIQDELTIYAQGEADTLPEPASYRQFIADTLARVESLDVAEFFGEKLGHITEPTLPYGLSDTLGDGSDIKECKVSLDSALSETIRAYAKTHQVSPAAIFHAAWALVVSACSGQQDVVFGTVLTGRMNGRGGVERLLGMLINTLPLSLRLGTQTADAFIAEVDSQLKALLPYEQISLAQAQKHSGLTSDVPLFSAMLNYRHSPKSTEETEENVADEDITVLTSQERTNYPFNLSVNDFGVAHAFGLDLQISDLVDVERVAGYVQSALQQLVQARQADTINNVSVLPQSEQQHLLVELNQTGMEYDNRACIQQLFESQANSAPDAIALTFQGQQMSYGELNKAANRVAHYLINEQQVTPDSLVGLCTSRSMEMVIGILGILKAGGAYVPLDPDYPSERLSYMVEDAGLGLILSHGAGNEVAKSLMTKGIGLEITELLAKQTASAEHNPEIAELTADNLAYVIYTSGSTGQPKGVQTPHKAVQRLITQPHFMPLNAQTVFLHSANIAFDAATLELWGPLLNGGRCVLYPNHFIDLAELNKVITAQQVNSMWLTAGLFSEWSQDCEAAESLRYVLAGGDVVHGADVMRVQQALPAVTVINGYGPTENTTFSCCYAIPELTSSEDIPIGKALKGDVALVLDSELNLVPYGSVGELCVGGDGLARGYLNQPQMTAERFIENPYFDANNPASSQRLYRTGDLVRYLPDGNLAFIGRVDDQIKIRGFRIELGEIAHQLNQQAGIDSSLVLAKEGPAGKYLVAYLKPISAIEQAEHAEFIEQTLCDLGASLPDYMVPSLAVVVQDWPLTANGKVDRKSLPEADIAQLQGQYVAPVNDIEAKLITIWSALLDVPQDKISTTENFFNLGGHSLLSVRLASEIRSKFAVEVSVKTLFSASTIIKQTEAIRLNNGDVLRQAVTPVARVELEGQQAVALPVSFAQQRLWFIDRLQGNSAEYNMPAAFNVDGQLDLVLVERAMQTIIARHEVLRTVYCDDENGAQQIIRHSVDFKLSQQDVSHLDTVSQQQAIAEGMQTILQAPFDLKQDLMVRAGYIATSDASGILLFNMHHIASDGWSMQVLVKEFVQLYQAFSQKQPNPLAPLTIQYGDYAHWQRDYLKGEVLEKQLNYWQQQLGEVSPVHNLPLDFKRPEVKQHQGAIVNGQLSAEVADKLTLLAKEQGLTPFMLLHGMLALLLSRHSNSQDIVIGTPLANRMQTELEPLIGFFVNTLVLRVNTAQQSLGAYFEHVKEVHLGAQSNQDVPFEQLVEVLKLQRSTAHTPLFQIMLTTQTDYGLTQDVSDSAWALNGAELSSLHADSVVSKFDLDINMSINQQGVSLNWTYDIGLFSHEHVSTLNTHLCRLLEGLATLDSKAITCTSLAALPMLGVQEQQLLVELNQSHAEHNNTASIQQLFESQADSAPDAIALTFQGQQMSYGELNKAANRVAHYLINEQQVTPDSLVGLCTSRSMEMVIGILGILKAGGAYVPLDPDYPSERLSYMVEDAKLGLILSHGAGNEVAKSLMTKGIGLEITELLAKQTASAEHNPEIAELTADNLAYVIYTSGSTGQPKGVQTPHKAVQRLITQPHFMPLNAQTVFLHSANIAFDAATLELWGPLLNGGRCVLYPNHFIDLAELNKVITAQQVNSMWLTAGLFSEWSQDCEAAESLRYVLAGGDVVHGADVMRVQQALPAVTVINGYGPTENTTFSCCYAIPELTSSEDIPIGKALKGDVALVLDSELNLVPYGSVGELCVGGDGLARGYLNQPQMTAERFIENPYFDANNPASSQRLYRTGDLVRYLPDGNLAFIGRVDDQIKIRGFRIELGEIAHQLNQQAGIDSSLVLAKEGPAGKYLVAYLKPINEVAQAEHAEFIEQILCDLGASLPDYMVPSLAVVVQDWPLTANGKVDRKALPEADITQLQGQYVAAQNEFEMQLCEIWSQLLTCPAEAISTQAHFFDIGGNSLLIVRLATLVRERFAIEFEIKELYSATRICDQALHIEYLQVKNNTCKQEDDYEELEW